MEDFIFYDYVYTSEELDHLKSFSYDENNDRWGRIDGDYVFGNRDIIAGNFEIPAVSKLFEAYIDYLPEIAADQFKTGLKSVGAGIICDIKLARYKVGNDVTWHSEDWAHLTHQYSNERIKRQFTCITSLNDNFVGGETEFSAGTLINPEENKTLIFPAHWEFAHRGREVTEGTKYVYINHIWF